MKLSSAQHAYIAQRAQWYFDIRPPVNSSDRGDWVVLTGDGLDDLNSTVAFINRYPGCAVMCDAGLLMAIEHGSIPGGMASANWMPADVEDVYAIKIEYIAYYGSVNKPPPSSHAWT